jgi:Tfp pilus assembly protein PilO
MNPIGSRLLRSKQQTWIAVVAVLFVGDFVLCGYVPSQRRLQALQAARAGQQRTIRTAAAQGEELPRLQQRLQDMEQMVASYGTRVPADGTLGTFLQQIAATMTRHRLADQVVVPGKEWASEGVNCIPLSMTCTGTLADTFGFFNDFQTLDRLVRIEQVTLTNDSGFTGQLRLQIEAVVFYRVAPRQAEGSTGGHGTGGAGNGT